mgnify:CR=1 FL=1
MEAMVRSVFTFCSGDATCPATVMRTIASDEMIKIVGDRRKKGKNDLYFDNNHYLCKHNLILLQKSAAYEYPTTEQRHLTVVHDDNRSADGSLRTATGDDSYGRAQKSGQPHLFFTQYRHSPYAAEAYGEGRQCAGAHHRVQRDRPEDAQREPL